MPDRRDRDDSPVSTLNVDIDGDTATMSIGGEVDLLRAPAIATALRDLLATEGVQRVLLDLQEVSFMDSTGIQVLVAALHDATATGLTVTMTAVSAPVRRLLVLTGTNEAFGLTA
jgi:anti-sigma B factor antagonist